MKRGPDKGPRGMGMDKVKGNQSRTISPCALQSKRSPLYQAGLIKRRRRTKAEIGELRYQIHNALWMDHPQSVRHVFYCMTDPRLAEPVEKTEHGYVQVQYQLKLMRQDGTIPYGWITDATRRGFHIDMFDDAADFITRISGLYRGDLWRHAGHYVEVWTESRSLASVIENLCKELAVSLYPSGGFTSLTLAYEAAEYINAVVNDREVPAEIIYIGDYDPAGVLIDQDVEAKLREHIDPHIDLNFYRLAITPDQIIEYDLPTKPRKAGERRRPDIKETVEGEAMKPADLRRLLRGKIESFLPAGELASVKIAEQSEREHLERVAGLMRGEG